MFLDAMRCCNRRHFALPFVRVVLHRAKLDKCGRHTAQGFAKPIGCGQRLYEKHYIFV